MGLYEEIRKELNLESEDYKLSKKKVEALEKAIFKDLKDKEPKCAKCGRRHRLTLDHIIPKEMLRSFGIDPKTEIIEGNYQILCELCNMYKSGRLDFSIPKTKELLLRLIKEL